MQQVIARVQAFWWCHPQGKSEPNGQGRDREVEERWARRCVHFETLRVYQISQWCYLASRWLFKPKAQRESRSEERARVGPEPTYPDGRETLLPGCSTEPLIQRVEKDESINPLHTHTPRRNTNVPVLLRFLIWALFSPSVHITYLGILLHSSAYVESSSGSVTCRLQPLLQPHSHCSGSALHHLPTQVELSIPMTGFPASLLAPLMHFSLGSVVNLSKMQIWSCSSPQCP